MAGAISQSKIVTIEIVGAVCKVSPRTLDVNIEDVITINNQTADSVAVLISEEKLVKDYKFNIDQGGDATLTVQDVAAGDYPYAVFCRQTDDFAQASSMPIIAVRR